MAPNTPKVRTLAVFSTWLKQLITMWSKLSIRSLPDRLAHLWEQLIGSYWFIPTAFVLVGTFLAPLMVYIDHQFKHQSMDGLTFVFIGGAAAARSITGAVAGAILGVAGTTFSITIAILSMASSQFGPRLLRNFLTDTANQLVLGTFIGTFSYSLLVLKSIRSHDTAFGVPQLAVTLSIVLAILCALLLVYFVQHTVRAIQASNVIQDASSDALDNIVQWYSEYCDLAMRQWVQESDAKSLSQFKARLEPNSNTKNKGMDNSAHPLNQASKVQANPNTAICRPSQPRWHCVPIYAPKHGYIQQIYLQDLIGLAFDYGSVLDIQANLGEFVTDHSVIAHLYQRCCDATAHVQKTVVTGLAKQPKRVDNEFWQRLSTCFHIGLRPVRSKDIDYSLGQITEIAIRALSPGINDPRTAVNCVQALTTCFSVMMRRHPPSPYHFYHPDRNHDQSTANLSITPTPILTVITQIPSIADYIDGSLGQIRRYATSDLTVLKALCQAMINLSYVSVNSQQQALLLRQIDFIQRAGEENLAYSELIEDLVSLCNQARRFIRDDNSKRRYFSFQGPFAQGDNGEMLSPV